MIEGLPTPHPDQAAPPHIIDGTLKADEIATLQPGTVIGHFPLLKLWLAAAGKSHAYELIRASNPAQMNRRKDLLTLVDESPVSPILVGVDPEAEMVTLEYTTRDIPKPLRPLWPEKDVRERPNHEYRTFRTQISFNTLYGNPIDRARGHIEKAGTALWKDIKYTVTGKK